jgi:hypothetical protein
MTFIEGCVTCQERLASHHKKTMMTKEHIVARDREAAINDVAKERYSESASRLSPPPIGSVVRMQYPNSKL